MKLQTILYTLCLLLISTISHAQKEVLFVGGAPLDTYQPRMISALLTEAFKRNGVQFKAKHYPSPRALMMSNSGAADGELHRVYDFHEVSKGQYPNLVRIESQLMSIYMAVFSNGAETMKVDREQLKTSTIGYLRGRKNVQNYLNELKPQYIAPQNTELGLFKMLNIGRLDYIISESFEGSRIIASNPDFSTIKETGRILDTKIYAYMHIKHAKLAMTIAETLNQMKRDGTFQEITDRIHAEILAEDKLKSQSHTNKKGRPHQKTAFQFV